MPLALNRINLTMLEKQFNAVELGAILIIDGARSHYSLSVEAVGFVPVAGCCGESGGISARPSSNSLAATWRCRRSSFLFQHI